MVHKIASASSNRLGVITPGDFSHVDKELQFLTGKHRHTNLADY